MTEQQALHKISAYCSKAERSESDVRKKLVAWQLDERSIAQIISYLKKEKFLNEERFCLAFIKDKSRFNKWGRTKITFELKKKNISDSLIRKAFEELSDEIDFDEPLMQILKTKLPTIKAKDQYERKAKLYRFAYGRGYSPQSIEKCLDRLLGQSEE